MTPMFALASRTAAMTTLLVMTQFSPSSAMTCPPHNPALDDDLNRVNRPRPPAETDSASANMRTPPSETPRASQSVADW